MKPLSLTTLSPPHRRGSISCSKFGRWTPAFAGVTFGMLVAAVTAGPAAAAVVAITNATVMTGAGATLDNATVVVDGGRIRSVGSGPAPAGATIIDGTGRTVTPGLVVGMSDLGIDEVAGVREANDTRARTSPFSASLDVVPAINGRDSAIAVRAPAASPAPSSRRRRAATSSPARVR